MRACYRGTKLQTTALAVVAEYTARLRLAKLGFIDRLEDLDPLKAEAFCVIGQELDRLEADDAKKRSQPRRGR